MAAETVELRLYLLGGFRVCLGGEEIPASRWRLAKARHLVKLLALAPGHHLHREQLLELLWPALDPEAAANNLYQVLYASRRILEPSGEHHFLLLQEETLYLFPDGSVWVDAEAFQSAAARAMRGSNPADYRAALDLYPADLLPEDLYQDWASEPRQLLRQEHQHLSLALARLLERVRDYPAAIEIFHLVHTLDPACEEAHVGLMRCYALVGQRQQALRLYQVLKDVLRRELEVDPSPESTHLYQEILTGQFPPRHSFAVEKPLNNLPHQLTRFIGRKVELERVKQLLKDSRLVTLTGTGGVGKTRLALKAAEELQGEYSQGNWLVNLAPISEPQFVLQAVSAIFEVQENGNRSLKQALLDYLFEKQLLLLLDNCEHLIEPCAQLVEQILNTCPKINILATSREALGIAGERIFRVPAFPTPDPCQSLPLEKLVEYDAVKLFIDRASTALPGFQLTEANSSDVLQLCQRLDGLPLALELAAGRMRSLSIRQVSARLENVFSLLVGGSRTALPKHQTLRALIDWSYHLLTEEEQRLFQRLSVFEGGWTLEAAEVVCEADFNLLTQLINKSLVVTRIELGEVTRYGLLQTIHQYAQQEFIESGEEEHLRDRHLDYFLDWVVGNIDQLQTSKTTDLLDQLEDEIYNLRLALRWALEGASGLRTGKGLHLASQLLLFWYMRGHIQEGLAWLKKGLALVGSAEAGLDHIRGDASLAVGVLEEDDHREEACQFLEESVRLFQETGDQQKTAHALCQLGHAMANVDPSQLTQADLEKALFYAGQGLALCRELGYKWSLAFALCMNAVIINKRDPGASIELMSQSHALFQEVGERLFLVETTSFLGSLALQQGDCATAARYGRQALELARALKSKQVIMRHLSLIGMAAWYLEDYPQMTTSFQEKLALSQELGDKALIAISLRSLGMAALRQGRTQEAAAFFLEAVRRDQGAMKERIPAYLAWFSEIALAAGQWSQAARLLGALESKIEAGFRKLERWDMEEVERCRAALQAQLDKDAFTAAFEEGKAFSLDMALAEALALGREVSQPN